MYSNNSVIYDFSDDVKRVSLITGLSVIIIIIVFFLPILNSFFINIGKLVVLLFLSYAFLLNLKTTNKAMSNTSNLFVDPTKSSIRDVMVLSYIFSISIIILIMIIAKSFFS